VVAALPGVPGGDLPAWRAVFGRALAEDPAGRFPTALEFAEELKEAFPPADRRLPADALLSIDGPQTDPGVQPFRPADLDRVELNVLPTSDPDLELRTAQATRYHDLETAPAVVSPAIDPLPIERAPIELESSARGRQPGLRDSYSSGTARSVADPPRSARWAVALAVIAGFVGMALAFAGGYAVGIRDRSPLAAVDARPAAAAPSPPPGPAQGREFTEGAVSEPANPPADSGPKPETTRAPVVTNTPTEKLVVANTPTEKPDGKTPVQPDTAPPAAVGQLLVRSTPAGARVFVDGRDRGQTPATIRDLPHGAHRLRVVRDGYAAVERRVVLTPSRPSQSLIIELERPRLAQSNVPTPATPGTVGRFVGALTVDSRPQGARVFVDGRLVGTTPVSLPEVNAGSHAVRLEREGYRRWSSSVRIVASERNRVTASLER